MRVFNLIRKVPQGYEQAAKQIANIRFDYPEYCFIFRPLLPLIFHSIFVTIVKMIYEGKFVMQEIKQNKMGTAPITPLLISMALPAMLSMLIQALYNIVDSIYVSRISSEALSAISIAFPVQTLLIALLVGTAVGVNSLVARRLGEQRKDDANQAATHGFLLAIATWLVCAVLGLLFIRKFFEMTTSNPVIIDMGVTYTTIVVVFSVGSFVQVCIEKTLQATGNMIVPMCSQLIGCVVNIILDPIMIFGYFGCPAMGIAGAAIATVIGQFMGMIFCILIITLKKHDVKITFKNFRLNSRIIKDIYQVGFPSIVMQAIGAVMVTFMNMILINFSEAAVNVLGIYYKLQSFVFMPIFGLTQGTMPIMGYNYGAGNKNRLLKALKTGTIFALAIMIIGTILFWIFPEVLLGLFNADAHTLDVGTNAMRSISLCFIPAAMGIMFSTVFQAVGKGFKSLILSLVRQLVCILPVAYILSRISLNAVWYAFPIAEGVSFILSIFMFIRLNKTTLSQLKPYSE